MVWAQGMVKSEPLSISFDEVTLVDAFRKVEQAAGVSIAFSDPALYEAQVTASFEATGIQDLLNALIRDFPMRVHKVAARQFVVIKVERKADETPSLRAVPGRVQDAERGFALAGATIYLKQQRLGQISDHAGTFTLNPEWLRALQKDTLVVQYVGYYPVLIPGDDIGTDQQMHVQLAQTPINLAEVSVVASRLQAEIGQPAASAYKMIPSNLQWVPSATDDRMIRALQLLPGVSGGNDGRAQLMIRGGTPYQHLVRLNGINLYHTHHFFGFTSALPESVIGDVDLFKGAYPAMYGGRTSGILDMGSTQPSNEFEATANLTSLHTGLHVNVPFSSQGAVQIIGRQSFANLIQTPFYRRFLGASLGQFSEEGGVTEADASPNRLTYQDLFMHATQGIGRGTSIDATFYLSNDEVNYFFSGIETIDMEDIDEENDPENDTDNESESGNDEITIRFDEQEGTEIITTGASSRLTHAWSNTQRTTLEWATTRFENAFFYASQPQPFIASEAFDERVTNRLNDLEFRANHQRTYGSGSTVHAGLWYQQLKVGFSLASLDGEREFEEQKAVTKGGYLQHEWRSERRLNVHTGLRLSHYSLTDVFYVEPRASLEYKVLQHLILKGAWGINHQFMDRLDQLDFLRANAQFWILSEEENPPARANQYIAGFRYENFDHALDVEVYRYNLSSIYEYLPNLSGNPELSENEILDARGQQEGLDVHFMKKSGPFQGWLSYSFTRSERQSEEIREGGWYPTNQDHRHKTALALVYGNGPWQISANWRYGSGTPYTVVFEERVPEFQEEELTFDEILVSGPANGERLASLHRLDLSVQRTMLLRRTLLEAGVTFYNVYNHRNVWRRNYRGDTPPALAINYLTPGFTPAFNLKMSFR
ncbi:MAG: TonB-dependent receptor [Bacteroidota bacterium]